MNILILGSGGREHALAWKVKQSPLVSNVFIAPGNAGTASLGANLPVRPDDFPAVRQAIIDHSIDMLIVGPELPLVEGIRDYLEGYEELHNLRIIGPGKEAARLEGSKAFAKEFMQRYGIPTAAYAAFGKGEIHRALRYLDEIQPPYVLKADGLAAGKGVMITDDKAGAKRLAEEILSGNKFGKAGERLLIEQYLEGIEMSVFALAGEGDYLILPPAKDYKRIGEGDTGLNTGGMGAVSPVPFADNLLMKKIENKIIRPTMEGLKSEGLPYTGFLFFGLMISNGEPYVIEYNVRMGDPETEVVIPRIESDLVELLDAAVSGTLRDKKISVSGNFAATVMAVSGGYPGTYKKGYPIHFAGGIKHLVFHAGTALQDGKTVTNGGRVLCVTAAGPSVSEAVRGCYDGLEHIRFDGMYYRRDIGKDLEKY